MQQAIDFSNITITSINFDGVEMSPRFNKEIGLLKKPFYVIPSNFEVPVSDPKNIAQTINQNLDSIEGLRYKYDDIKHCWEVDFGTKPIELTVDPKDYKMKRIISLKKWVAIQAATYALDKYPNLVEEYFGDYLPQPPTDLRWCRFVINLYYDKDKKVIIVEFNRLWSDSDSFTFYQLFNHVKEAFKK
jgi:hypothetical protein